MQIRYVLLILLIIPLATAITLETDTILNDGTYNYTINKNITDISDSINITVGEIYIDGVKIGSYSHRDRLTTTREFPSDPGGGGAGGGSTSESEKPPGNIKDNCERINGTLIQDEDGNPLCIIDEETNITTETQVKNIIEEYMDGPYEGMIKIALILGGGLAVFLFLTKGKEEKDEEVSQEE